jgi:ribosomal-protein-alanine N-acetyltransferase
MNPFKTLRPSDPPQDVQIRWLIRRDMGEVLSIERRSFQFPWSEEEFLCCLRQRNCIGVVIEENSQTKGFMIYELHKEKLRILSLAIDPEDRRCGLGVKMIVRLIDKLSEQRRHAIEAEVRESNLTAQLFFQSCGFRAVRVLRKHYDENREDAYLFRYRIKEPSP